MKPTSTLAITFIAVVLVGVLAFTWLFPKPPDDVPASADAANVAIVDGVQIVTITAKGGYSPEVSTVQAAMPVTLRFVTKGTFDCSSAIRIPSKDVDTILPPTGSTDIALGTLAPGMLEGTCGMGMFRFAVDVQS
jgi:P-type Cu+ transporter